MRKANVTKILSVDYAFESALYDQTGSLYFKEDVADASAVPGEPGEGGP